MLLLAVTDLMGNSEALVDIQNGEMYEELNGEFSLSFTVFDTEKNRHSYSLLQDESIIEIDGHEFRVKQLQEVLHRKTVSAQHIFFDLIDERKIGIFGGTKTADEIFNWLLEDTEWTYEIVDDIPIALLANFGNDNVLALIRLACKTFGCSIKIERNKHLLIGVRVGSDKDEQFRYKHNIKTIKKTVDSTKLSTCIRGIGANGIVAVYYSPNVAVYGERWAEEVEDDRYASVTTLEEYLKTQLQDVPEISLDIDAITLGMNISLNDGVWTIYEPLGIEYLSYAQAIKSFPFSNKPAVITLSNDATVTAVKQTISDVIRDTVSDANDTKKEVEKNKKETRSKFEQTEEKISMEVERINGDIVEAKAEFSVTADEIRAEVTAQAETLQGEIESNASLLSQTAREIRLEVSSVQDTVSNHESALSIQAQQISSKVSSTDFNGDTISSLINQSASTVKIQASKIELNGVVTTNDIQVGNSISLGYSTSGAAKSIIFNGNGSSIQASGDNISIHASAGIAFMGHALHMVGGTFYSRVDFSQATVEGLSVTAKFG